MNPLPLLTPEEIRVFGSLIEKSQATPEYYPMTLNAIVNACNQKSSREPVVEYSEQVVRETIEELREKRLVATTSGTTRVPKYVHRAGERGMGLNDAQAAVLSVLLLRGEQTAGELRTRTARQVNFNSLDSVKDILSGLMTEEMHLVEEAPGRPGQVEVRYRHRLTVYNDTPHAKQAAVTVPSIRSEVEDLRRLLVSLQEELLRLREDVAHLHEEFGIKKPTE